MIVLWGVEPENTRDLFEDTNLREALREFLHAHANGVIIARLSRVQIAFLLENKPELDKREISALVDVQQKYPYYGAVSKNALYWLKVVDVLGHVNPLLEAAKYKGAIEISIETVNRGLLRRLTLLTENANTDGRFWKFVLSTSKFVRTLFGAICDSIYLENGGGKDNAVSAIAAKAGAGVAIFCMLDSDKGSRDENSFSRVRNKLNGFETEGVVFIQIISGRTSDSYIPLSHLKRYYGENHRSRRVLEVLEEIKQKCGDLTCIQQIFCPKKGIDINKIAEVKAMSIIQGAGVFSAEEGGKRNRINGKLKGPVDMFLEESARIKDVEPDPVEDLINCQDSGLLASELMLLASFFVAARPTLRTQSL